ncbi:MAG: hypothetical protein WA954_01290, partial [Parerythrobacter sp.]
MTIPVQDRLYALLPALYRLRDSEPAQGEALRALMALIEQQFLDIEANIDQLYDDAFIETCQEKIVPYIGELLGAKSLQATAQGRYSQRAYVANTILYRQRKGTAFVLEQLAFDVTNWPARAVEYFERVECTQHSNHLRMNSWRTPDLRETATLDLINTPFETAQHTADIRNIERGRGQYNLSNVGLHLWRLQSYHLSQVQALAVPNSPGLYWINPLGEDLALFNRPMPETEIASLSREENVPGALRRRPLYDEIGLLVRNSSSAQRNYFGEQPVFQLFADGEAIAPKDLSICDLSDMTVDGRFAGARPSSTKRVTIDPVLGRLAIPQGQDIPKSLRVSYAYGFSSDIGGGPYDRRDSVEKMLDRTAITWQIGVSASATAVDEEEIVADLAEAITRWNRQPPGTIGVIVLMDNSRYVSNNLSINIPADSQLLIVSANWPAVARPLDSSEQIRRQWVATQRRAHIQGSFTVQGTAANDQNPGQLALNGLLVEGTITVASGNLRQLQIAHCTLLPKLGGQFGSIAGKALPRETLPRQTNNRLSVEVNRSITGPLYLSHTFAKLTVTESIIDATQAKQVWFTQPLQFPLPAGEFVVRQTESIFNTVTIQQSNTLDSLKANLTAAFQAITTLTIQVETIDEGLNNTRLRLDTSEAVTFETTASDLKTLSLLSFSTVAIAASASTEAAPTTDIQRSTVFGSSYVQAYEQGTEVIWTGSAIAQKRQQGCIRFSYVPPHSRLPRRYRCQPDTEIEDRLAQVQQGSPRLPAEEQTQRQLVQSQTVPRFTSRTYGNPAYAQLSIT